MANDTTTDAAAAGTKKKKKNRVKIKMGGVTFEAKTPKAIRRALKAFGLRIG